MTCMSDCPIYYKYLYILIIVCLYTINYVQIHKIVYIKLYIYVSFIVQDRKMTKIKLFIVFVMYNMQNIAICIKPYTDSGEKLYYK